MFLENILKNPVCHPIQDSYERWYTFMDERIEFWLPNSVWHTKTHCARVLLLALLIGHQKGLSEEEKDALAMAAVFHDSRRLDDGIDKGHGSRAAAYYKDYCLKYDLPYNEQTYYITYYHDQDDSLGISEMKNSLNERTVLLYQIFKDADALDRFRLGPNALDVNFLRREEAHRLVSFAKDLFNNSAKKNS
ncbi:HD domain-containing protein [Lysinibacillus sp. OL1_EC]|uniref:HD domain-containing protein n=1 Tax=unclassified Lysinibacillus TaxID=2636778 RepID=UPI00103D6F8C|nr:MULTISPECIES: HD domain-containing protein [unclassified Lysinibacillus]MCM0624495.1 HD domain-containing protein [Lysinibacillus sp. OL1_EC]TBV88236.1 hypothetical protein EW028_07295 [Lysinibacillus sp. OL1]